MASGYPSASSGSSGGNALPPVSGAPAPDPSAAPAAAARRRASGAVFGVAIVAVLLWAALLTVVARGKFGGDPRGFLFLGERLYHPTAFDGIPRCGRYGYDGQFYAALATDPFLRSPDTLKALDAPGYRASRILIPLLAWCAALGNARGAIVAYQVLSWTLSVLAVAVVALWLRDKRRSPWWGLTLAASAGLVTAIFRSTQDGDAAFLIVAALWLAQRQADVGALGAGSAANLCRETGYLAPLAVGVHELVARRYLRAFLYMAVPLVPQLAWQAYLQATWHPNLRFPASVAAPFAGLAGKVAAVISAQPGLFSQELWGTLGAGTTVAAGLAIAFRRGRLEPPRLAFMAFAALALFLAPRAYADVYGFSRHLIPAPFLAIVLAAREENLVVRTLLISVVATFSVAGLLMIAGELRPWIWGP